MITLMLVWFLVGYVSGSYILLLDMRNEIKPIDAPLDGIACLLLGGVLGPFTICPLLRVYFCR